MTVHDGSGVCGGIKTADDKWNIEGHKKRIIRVTEEILGLFARLYDGPNTPAMQGRLPSLHSSDLVSVLRSLASYSLRLRDLDGEYSATKMQDETNWVVNGMIRRDTKFAVSLLESILSGPHVFVANPLFKTPRRICTEKGHYDPIDLTAIPSNYQQRTNYVPACELESYRARLPRVSWSDQKPVTDYYRMASREMLSQAGERTLISAILPPGPAHISTLISVGFRSQSFLMDFASMAMSLPIDFLVKSTGQGHASKNLLEQLPVLVLSDHKRRSGLWIRVLMLNCLTVHYGQLWTESWQESYRQERWTKADCRLKPSCFSQLSDVWQWAIPLRTDYERRQALVEIDVLAARSLALTIEELCAVYRIQFPVLQQNERDTWYDQNGRIVFTNSKALPGVGFSRPEWERIRDMASGTATRTRQDDTLPSGPRDQLIEYVAPFDRCDREADYVTAWKFFDEAGL